MQALLWPLISWALREVILKFLIMGAVFVVVSELVPLIVELLAPFIGVANLDTVFSALPESLWWFLDFARLDDGLPLVISASVARFLIRRIPFLN